MIGYIRETTQDWKAIQYFRENLDWIHSLGIDIDKLKTVLDLAESQLSGIRFKREWER